MELPQMVTALRKRIAQREDGAEVVYYTFYDVAVDKKILAELKELRLLRLETTVQALSIATRKET